MLIQGGPVKTGREKIAGVFFVTFCTPSLLRGLPFLFINLKYSSTSVTSSAVTSGYISQKTSHPQNLCQQGWSSLALGEMSPPVLGVQKPLENRKAFWCVCVLWNRYFTLTFSLYLHSP